MGFAGHKRFVLILLFCSLVAFDCIVSKKKEDTINQQLLTDPYKKWYPPQMNTIIW
ncbi:hypothetical protein LEP1GSC163_0040 [Leptospira santarosai str. CBC379]|nr:hypothetical protein LEP1GSC163_0040 [Leptospira santarosai str. CBC379]